MAYNGYLEYANEEISNLARTAAYASAMGINAIRVDAASVDWLRAVNGDSPYTDPATDNAPWYDPNVPESAEFAGTIVVSSVGMGDSAQTAAITEYNTDGGNVASPRNAVQAMVFSMYLAATTERGAQYGLSWLKTTLRKVNAGALYVTNDPVTTDVFAPQIASASLTFLRSRYQGTGTPDASWLADQKRHYNRCRVTVGVSVNALRVTECQTIMQVSFTVTAADPFQYGDRYEVFAGLGSASGPFYGDGFTGAFGHVALTEMPCSDFDYAPFQDPLYPSLIEPPTPPNFYPDGWDIVEGDTFDRFWAICPDDAVPNNTPVVPTFILSTADHADQRMVRLRVYDAADVSDPSTICPVLWECIVTYLPGGVSGLFIDGEQQVVYVWDGVSAQVQRADSLVYGTDGGPIQWPSFTLTGDLRICLETMLDSSDASGTTDILVDLYLAPKDN